MKSLNLLFALVGLTIAYFVGIAKSFLGRFGNHHKIKQLLAPSYRCYQG
jgi:hypothetical protein